MMKNFRNIVCVIVTCHVLLCIMVLANASNNGERQAYIVYMGDLQENRATSSPMDEHHRILLDIIGDERQAKESRIHSYGKSFNGFVAHLSPQEVEKLREKENVISVFPNQIYELFTTRSWDYVGMTETVERRPQAESDMIVAVLDTGIYMDLPDFDDKGYGPPPAKWKGKCDKGANFTGCNNKVIGAQVMAVNALNISEYERTPADFSGHGTHVASIIGGNAVTGASLYGLADGTVRGGVPSARLATYKVCFMAGCSGMDVLEAIDTAIDDGVDIISISIGSTNPANYFEDATAIGAFHAQKNGILTICGCGNDGPQLHTVANVAPWITSVAASGVDRELQTITKLGNGKTYYSTSVVNAYEKEEHMYPLTSGALAKNGNGTNGGDSSACMGGTLNEEKVKGAIVHCLGLPGQRDGAISQLHGAGVIITTNAVLNSPIPLQEIPTTVTIGSEGEYIDQYIKSTDSPTAVIYKSTIVNRAAPFMGLFSSRGPQIISPNILKPDIAAPGVNILAAWSAFAKGPVVKYNIRSGTSMACPHVSAAAAYVKSFHPKWSPAAIRSAIMTTAKSMKVDPVEGALAYGSGMINPVEALNPGLIYDINTNSYISFLCREGYNTTVLALFVLSENFNCSKVKPAKGTDGLNYPSMHLSLQKDNSNNFSAVFYRTVTNVGVGASIYKANVDSPKELSISVFPKTLSFTKANQKLSFKVDVKGMFVSETSFLLSASLVWSDSSNHNVRSPILVYRNTTPGNAMPPEIGNPRTTKHRQMSSLLEGEL